jgi:phosphoglycerate dehydrogenase-like enzyme
MKIATFLCNDAVEEHAFSDANAQVLVELLPDCTLSVCADEADFIDELHDADVALVWQFKQDWFPLAPKLRVISTPAAGRDYFQVAPPPDITILYGAFHGRIMGETAVGMILGISHGLIQHARRMNENAALWPQNEFTGDARCIRNSHVAILGFGAIGHHAGRMLKHFGARITGIRRDPAGDSPLWFDDSDKVVSTEELDRVLPFTDHLLCVLPSGEETTHLINADRLKLLPKTAYVYNIGRGNVIDEKALAKALKKGTIAGAVLDVFNSEPLAADSPLRTAPNAYLYPHVSAVSPEYMTLYVEELAERLQQAGMA